EWLLSPFQIGESIVFTQHIQAGLRMLVSSPSNLLIFSGSRTRSETQKSEAQSYLDLAQDNDFWGILEGYGKEEVRERIVLEEQSLDSFGNLVFSVLRFWKCAGLWPEHVTIVSHEFKRERFLELHVATMRWPRDRVEFVGIDPGYMREGSEEWDGERAAEVRRGERERGFMVWKRDGFGKSEVLRRKRWQRNYFEVGQLMFDSEADRERSQIRSKIVDFGHGSEEYLKDEIQPWE
ncbi:hypothetical protein OIDMADRAFT_113505, partial [Oidiodendron maius Zn]